MIKRISKYQQGGTTASKEEQLVQLFQMAAQNAQVDPEALVKKAQELGEDENATAQFMQGLQLCAQGDPEGIKFIQSLFKPAYKQGGKIHDFVCKHSKGGRTANCGCKQEGGSIRPGFEYLGENILQDRYNPNFFEVVSNGYRVNGQEVAVPTRSGAYRMGADKDNPGAWDNGQRVYTQNQFDNIRNFYENVLPNSNRVQGPKEKLAGMECGGKVTKASDGSDGIPQAKNAKAARRAASKNTVSVGNSGRAKNRKIGAATDKFGGQHLYEDSVIDGSWSDVYVDVPHPGDTIVTQSFPVAGGNDTVTRTYPMGSDQYESVMSRMRPAFRMFFPQYKCGGKVEKAQDGTRSLYQQIAADGPETYVDGYGTIREMNESPIIAGLRKAYHWINMDRTLSDNAYSQKHGYSKPLTGMPPAVYISPVAQEIELAKIIGNRIPKQKPTIRISENLGNGKFSAIDDFGKPVIYDAERDKGLFQIIDKNTFKPEPGFDWDIDKRYGQSLSMIEPTQYDFSKLGRITISWPEFIGKTALKWAPGIVGSAALGSYIATKKDKKKNSGGGGR